MVSALTIKLLVKHILSFVTRVCMGECDLQEINACNVENGWGRIMEVNALWHERVHEVNTFCHESVHGGM